MIPDYQTLMRPVLECAEHGEVHIREVIDRLADKFELTEEERQEMLPSGRQSRFANRVHWAKGYLKQAGLVSASRRGHFEITDRGKIALSSGPDRIDRKYLLQFEEFRAFQTRKKGMQDSGDQALDEPETSSTPDEILRAAHASITASLEAELLDRVREATPDFFEDLIIKLLLSMGYGGASEDAGRALGRTGDNGIDGVIDQDPLGVDQIYVQAKRYADGNTISAGAMREFFGALSLKNAQKGIFFTTSSFSPSANQTASNLGKRIVLIDGLKLASLMVQYNIGCREEETIYIKKVDEDFFE